MKWQIRLLANATWPTGLQTCPDIEQLIVAINPEGQSIEKRSFAKKPARPTVRAINRFAINQQTWRKNTLLVQFTANKQSIWTEMRKIKILKEATKIRKTWVKGFTIFSWSETEFGILGCFYWGREDKGPHLAKCKACLIFS